MKLIYSLALLLAMGCQSKPTDSKYYDSAYGKKLDLQIENLNCPIGAALQYDIISGRFGCEQIGTFHATAAQWEAAQGLYNSEVFCEGGKSVMLKYSDGSWRPYSHTDAMKMHSVTVACAPPYPSLTIFPPSGDAK